MGIPRHGDAQPVDEYLLPEHWCFHIYSYHATLEIDGCTHAIRPGVATLIPPCTRMIYRYEGPSEHVYFHFRPGSGGREVDAAMVFDLAEYFASMDERARKAVAASRLGSAYPQACLWALLCEAVELGKGSTHYGSHHPTVQAAVQHIEQRLAHPISVAQLCREVGVSYGYLTRLFKVSHGLTVGDYVRARRADQASHLLGSTTLPIKAIAKAVGVPDLQQFNRLIHGAHGCSPREHRRLISAGKSPG